MKWLDYLEKRYPRLAIPGLIRTVSFFMLLTFGLEFTGITRMTTWVLWGNGVLSGEVWRVITFLFVPVSTNPFFLIFELMILVMTGDGLESAWGSFRLTIYYLVGALFIIMIAFIVPYGIFDSYYLNLSLFLAFATIYPDYEILFFFVLPLKIKYIAMFSGAIIAWDIISKPLVIKIVALMSIGNYLLFFGPAAWTAIKKGAQNYERKRKFDIEHSEKPRHICNICGKDNVNFPDLQFRYCTCAECGENGKAFCTEHLQIHKQKISNSYSVH